MVSKRKRRKMKPGGGSKKGSAFERKMAREISTWWYGEEGYLWRRPGPGTGFFKKDKYRHSGDIVPSVDRKLPKDFPFHIELKCWAKKRLKLDMILWPDRSPIKSIWDKAIKELRCGLKPMLILKANNIPPICVMRRHDLEDILRDAAVNRGGDPSGNYSANDVASVRMVYYDDFDDEYVVYAFPLGNLLKFNFV